MQEAGQRALGAPGMTEDGLDLVIHAPARLRIVVTLAALRDGDDL
jgi:hypothetical protein